MPSLMELPVETIRNDFPVLQRRGRDGQTPLIYLDNAATTHKPQQVLKALNDFYSQSNGTVRRGVYFLSELSTAAYEEARQKVAKFLGAENAEQIIFTKGCTDSLNLVASSFSKAFIKPGDQVLISAMEHHANIVPWQIVCEERGAELKIIPISPRGEILLDEYQKLLNPKVKIVAVNHISNALGTINPIKQMVEMAHAENIPVLVDGAQAAPHLQINIQELGCDFYAFSGHKVYGPTGIGVLYGKSQYLEQMPPYQAGGDMIEKVSFTKTTFAKPPAKFEAGTPAIAQAIGLGAALDYLQKIGLQKIEHYEQELLNYAQNLLSEIPELGVIGQATQKASLISFVLKGVHPHDIGTILDEEFGIAVRAGHHCAQPLMQFYQVPATTRASFAFYNTKTEIETLAQGLKSVVQMFK
jgi:cysteine desulfurase/selenocysteine lyase